MSDLYIFDIPIFRCELNKWSDEIKNEKKKLADYFQGLNKELPFPFSYYEKMADTSMRSRWNAFYYSELVGMIRIKISDMQIIGDLWFIKQNPNRTPKNKTWTFVEPEFKITILNKFSNKEIFHLIEEKLLQIKLKGFIDMSVFKNTGKYIDYLSIMKQGA
jgi:hypothetical protein